MKKAVMVAGFFIILIGFVILSMSNYSVEKVDFKPLGKEYVPNGWNVTIFCSEGEKLLVRIGPGKHWVANDRTDEFHDFTFLPVDVNVSDPKGDNTTFEVIYRPVPGVESLDIFIVKVISKGSGLNLTTFTHTYNERGVAYTSEYLEDPEISGIVKFNGTYSVNVDPLGLPGPPADLTAERLLVNKATAYPYRPQFYYAGSLTIAGGLALIFFARSSVKRRYRFRRKIKVKNAQASFSKKPRECPI